MTNCDESRANQDIYIFFHIKRAHLLRIRSQGTARLINMTLGNQISIKRERFSFIDVIVFQSQFDMWFWVWALVQPMSARKPNTHAKVIKFEGTMHLSMKLGTGVNNLRNEASRASF